jgi:hypothetical protein
MLVWTIPAQGYRFAKDDLMPWFRKSSVALTCGLAALLLAGCGSPAKPTATTSAREANPEPERSSQDSTAWTLPTGQKLSLPNVGTQPEGAPSAPPKQVPKAEPAQDGQARLKAAQDAAAAFHAKRFPKEGWNGSVFLSGNHARAQYAFVGEPSNLPPDCPKNVQYWLTRDEDAGAWEVFNDLPVHLDAEFVFKELAAGYLSQRYHQEITAPQIVRMSRSGVQKAILFRFVAQGQLQEVPLTFVYDPYLGWRVRG